MEKLISFASWRHQDHPISIKQKIGIRRPRRFVEELHDRGAIEPRSRSLRCGIASIRSDGNRQRFRVSINPRSWPDRDPIVAKIVFFRLIRSHNDTHSMPIGKPRCHPKESLHDPAKPPPRPLQLPTKSG